ncbi:MAG TPA: PPC domain-containing DNA-binding protein [Isosphaeraceae bacterium]|nr:PPC domain-containing DNA-binding protein [Isosphaeraceae bacterium]
MKSKLLHDHHGQKTYAIIFEHGDEVVSPLLDFARQHRIHAAQISAIGAFEKVTLGYFEWERKDYKKIPVHEQVEVLSLLGDIAEKDGEPKLHAHVVVGRSTGATLGGHLVEATVRPTLEVILTESPAHLRKSVDPETGLALIELD